MFYFLEKRRSFKRRHLRVGTLCNITRDIINRLKWHIKKELSISKVGKYMFKIAFTKAGIM